MRLLALSRFPATLWLPARVEVRRYSKKDESVLQRLRRGESRRHGASGVGCDACQGKPVHRVNLAVARVKRFE